MLRFRYFVLAALLLCSCAGVSLAQDAFPDGKLDPTRNISAADTAPAQHAPLPEQYIWTAGDAAALHADHNNYGFAKPDTKSAPHYFRYTFQLEQVPPTATLYLAGPRSAKIYVNGELVDRVASDVTSPLGIHVFATDIEKALRSGANTLALEVVRGRGIVSVSNSRIVQQQTFGEILVAKIVPAAPGIDRRWRSADRTGKVRLPRRPGGNSLISTTARGMAFSRSDRLRVQSICFSGMATRVFSIGPATRAFRHFSGNIE